MESEIRNIIRRELKVALSEIEGSQITAPRVEDIIYDFEAGRAFGVNRLAVDISGLNEYYMSSYFPRSEMQENWMFEIETSFGAMQLIEVVHTLKSDYNSYWELRISEVEAKSNVPVVIKESGFIRSYPKFVKTVNSTLSKYIDPNIL